MSEIIIVSNDKFFLKKKNFLILIKTHLQLLIALINSKKYTLLQEFQKKI